MLLAFFRFWRIPMETSALKLRAQELMMDIRWAANPDNFDYDLDALTERRAEIQDDIDSLASEIDNPAIGTWRKLYDLAESHSYRVNKLGHIVMEYERIIEDERTEAKRKAKEQAKQFKDMVDEAFEGHDKPFEVDIGDD